MADQPHLLAALRRSPQGFAQPVRIGGDDTRSGGKDMRGGPVVLFQPDHRSTRKIRLEPQDIAHLGPAPAIDRLIIIAHAADVVMRLRQQPQPQVLRHIGILILVHQTVFEPALILRQHIRMRLKDRNHMQQQIAEIHRVQGAQPVLIGRVKLGSPVVIGPRFGRRHAGRRQRPVLPAVDQPGQHPCRPALFVDISRRNHLLQQAQLIIRIQNGEV